MEKIKIDGDTVGALLEALNWVPRTHKILLTAQDQPLLSPGEILIRDGCVFIVGEK